MARDSKLRITKNDRAEYKRIQNNINAKIRRTYQKFGIDLSDKKAPSLDSFKTRKEFNEFKRNAETFLSRSNLNYQYVKNTYGVVVSKKELAKTKRDVDRSIRLAKKKQTAIFNKLKDKPFIIDNQKRGTIKDRLRTMSKSELTGISIPNEFNFDVYQSKKQFEMRQDFAKLRSKEEYYNNTNERLKNNFITTLEQSFNSDVDDIVELIRNIPSDDFLELSIMIDEFDIRTYYYTDQEGIEDQDRAEVLRDYLKDYNKIDLSLKNF